MPRLRTSAHLERGLQILVAAFKHLPRTRTHPMPRQCRYVAAARISRGKVEAAVDQLLLPPHFAKCGGKKAVSNADMIAGSYDFGLSEFKIRRRS